MTREEKNAIRLIVYEEANERLAVSSAGLVWYSSLGGGRQCICPISGVGEQGVTGPAKILNVCALRVT